MLIYPPTLIRGSSPIGQIKATRCWKQSYSDYAWCSDTKGIEEHGGHTLCTTAGGGDYKKEARV
jgi:hypothetical protein